ncbi:MAG: geranylgeranylglycerol-phosphate geranylgeranyltransferase [Bacteroidia bacterium]
MTAFFKLIRTGNLLIIAFTQYMVRWCIIYPIFKAYHLELQLTELQFFFLVLSTTMIAAGGYIINDYFDVRIDKINNPARLVIDKGVKRRVAIGAHLLITIIAILIALYLSYSISYWKIAFIHLICAIGLWFYSTTFKREFLIGNIIIALFVALVPLIVGIYELLSAYHNYGLLNTKLSYKTAWTYIIGLSFFAFLTTFLREIIKDMEDYDGDKKYGRKTMPIVLGIRNTKNVSIFIAIIIIISLAYFQLHKWNRDGIIDIIYIFITIQIPLVFLVQKINSASAKKEYRLAGNIAKIIMLSGICYLFVFAHYVLSQIK